MYLIELFICVKPCFLFGCIFFLISLNLDYIVQFGKPKVFFFFFLSNCSLCATVRGRGPVKLSCSFLFSRPPVSLIDEKTNLLRCVVLYQIERMGMSLRIMSRSQLLNLVGTRPQLFILCICFYLKVGFRHVMAGK